MSYVNGRSSFLCTCILRYQFSLHGSVWAMNTREVDESGKWICTSAETSPHLSLLGFRNSESGLYPHTGDGLSFLWALHQAKKTGEQDNQGNSATRQLSHSAHLSHSILMYMISISVTASTLKHQMTIIGYQTTEENL